MTCNGEVIFHLSFTPMSKCGQPLEPNTNAEVKLQNKYETQVFPYPNIDTEDCNMEHRNYSLSLSRPCNASKFTSNPENEAIETRSKHYLCHSAHQWSRAKPDATNRFCPRSWNKWHLKKRKEKTGMGPRRYTKSPSCPF